MATPAPKTSYEQAMSFIATYEGPHCGDYERHVVRIARQWVTIQRPGQATQRVVDRLLDELAQPPPPDYGCGWTELGQKFRQWAKAEGWLDKPRKGKT